jgi:Protein of unknown function (DUF4058)
LEIAMPVHDWKRVSAGTFHDFHSAWIIHLKERFNNGLLPSGYYALSEQHAGSVIADVLTLQAGEPESEKGGPVAVAEAPPRVGRKLVASPNAAYRATRRTLTIRHASNHRVVALLEILSPANKDRAASVNEFVEKAHAALHQGCHLLIGDLLPPSPHDPQGIHAAIWESFDPEDYVLPRDKPLTLASYVAGALPEAYVEHLAVGDELPEMPLFLQTNFYVDVPLEETYRQAYRGVPAYWRAVIEGSATPN